MVKIAMDWIYCTKKPRITKVSHQDDITSIFWIGNSEKKKKNLICDFVSWVFGGFIFQPNAF